MKDLSGMTTVELGQYVSKLKADLEEIETERMFVLSQTGLHVSASAVRKYELEINELRSRIEDAEQVIRARHPD